LFFTKKGGVLALKYLQVIPIVDLNIEIHIDPSVFLHDQQAEHVCSLNYCVVGMIDIVFAD
jgi:hypothetical protein